MQFGNNLRDRDNLSTKDKRPVRNVSVIRRFHCILMLFIFTTTDLSDSLECDESLVESAAEETYN